MLFAEMTRRATCLSTLLLFVVEMSRHAHLSVWIGAPNALLYGGAGLVVQMTRNAHLSMWIGTTDALLYGGTGVMWQQALCNSHNLHGQLS